MPLLKDLIDLGLLMRVVPLAWCTMGVVRFVAFKGTWMLIVWPPSKELNILLPFKTSLHGRKTTLIIQISPTGTPTPYHPMLLNSLVFKVDHPTTHLLNLHNKNPTWKVSWSAS